MSVLHSGSVNLFMACTCYIPVKSFLWFCFGMLTAEAVCLFDLTCAVTPAAPHVFQLGKLHSAQRSNEACSRVAKDPSTQIIHWIMRPVATEPMLFLKKVSPPSCQSVLNTPLDSSFFMTHGHMIAADWACPLMFARAGVHNVHAWQRKEALRGCVITKCKGR